jgi:hypothetical protein
VLGKRQTGCFSSQAFQGYEEAQGVGFLLWLHGTPGTGPEKVDFFYSFMEFLEQAPTRPCIFPRPGSPSGREAGGRREIVCLYLLALGKVSTTDEAFVHIQKRFLYFQNQQSALAEY